MKWETTAFEPKTTRHWRCDFCDKETHGSNGSCGWAIINSCEMCGKDFCYDHGKYFSEFPDEDYPHGVHVCQECREEAEQAWDEAMDTAGRYEDMKEVFKRCVDDIRFMRAHDRKQKHIPFTFHWERKNET